MLRQVGIEGPGLRGQEGFGRRRQAVIDLLDDALLVDRVVERLAHGAILEHRQADVEGDVLDEGLRHRRHDAVLERLGLVVMVRRDALEADIVDVPGLELGVEHGEVGDVFE